MNNIKITKVAENDLDQLQKIGRQTFYETLSGDLTVVVENEFIKWISLHECHRLKVYQQLLKNHSILNPKKF